MNARIAAQSRRWSWKSGALFLLALCLALSGFYELGQFLVWSAADLVAQIIVAFFRTMSQVFSGF